MADAGKVGRFTNLRGEVIIIQQPSRLSGAAVFRYQSKLLTTHQ